MKRKITLLLCCFGLLLPISSNAQLGTLDSLFQVSVKKYNTDGWFWFHTGVLPVSQLFTTYKPVFLPETDDDAVLTKDWTDAPMSMHHYRYQQEYKGIPVEGCEFTEHCRDGSVVYAHGKLCPEIASVYKDGYITQEAALNKIFLAYPSATFAWQNADYEYEIQTDLNDPNATYFPTGELVFALKPEHTIQFQMNPADYRMAWKFDIVCLQPHFHHNIYVDAHTGVILKNQELVCSNGSADIPVYGSQTIDTRYIGWPQNHHILNSNDGTTRVHTKNHSGPVYSLVGETSNPSTSWGTNHWQTTMVHWAAMQTWLYFENDHSRIGIEGSNFTNRVRVWGDKEWATVTANNGAKNGAWYDRRGGRDYLYFGYFDSLQSRYTGEVSTVAHEYTHGITKDESNLTYFRESGALDESFADIFGFLARRDATGITNWIIGASNYANREKRSLQDPNSLGIHYTLALNANGGYNPTEAGGQPDTYEGDFWFDYTLSNQDNGGVHVNSGVMNHWFYLLCNGGSGFNDLNNFYQVTAISIEDAAAIVYSNMVNNMQSESEYTDAMSGSITAAEELFGVCSAQAVAVEKAWYAVGLGNGTICGGTVGIKEVKEDFTIFPNPATNYFTFKLASSKNSVIEIYSVNGQIVKAIPVNSISETIDVSDLRNGVYFVKLQGESKSIKKLIKH